MLRAVPFFVPGLPGHISEQRRAVVAGGMLLLTPSCAQHPVLLPCPYLSTVYKACLQDAARHAKCETTARACRGAVLHTRSG